jgi:hypothetical protein
MSSASAFWQNGLNSDDLIKFPEPPKTPKCFFAQKKTFLDFATKSRSICHTLFVPGLPDFFDPTCQNAIKSNGSTKPDKNPYFEQGMQ